MQQIEMCFIQSFIGTFLTSLMNRTVINWIYSYFILNLQTAGFNCVGPNIWLADIGETHAGGALSCPSVHSFHRVFTYETNNLFNGNYMFNVEVNVG